MKSLSKLYWFCFVFSVGCIVVGDEPPPITATNNISNIVVNVAIQNPPASQAQGDEIPGEEPQFNVIVITNASLQGVVALTNATLVTDISTRLRTNGVVISTPRLLSPYSGGTGTVIRVTTPISKSKKK